MILAAVARHVLRAPARWLPVVLLVAVAVAVYGGTGGGLRQIERSTDQLYDELVLPDLVFHVQGATRQRVPKALGDVRAAWFFESQGLVEASDGRATMATVRSTFPGRDPAVDRPRLMAGDPLAAGDVDGVWVDPRWAEEHGVSIGDSLHLELPLIGGDVVIRGLAVYPDHLLTSADESATMPVPGTRAVITLSEERLFRRLMWRTPVNRLAVKAREGQDLDAVQSNVSALLDEAGFEVGRVERGDELFSVVCHRGRITTMRDTLPAMVLVFQGLAALGWFLALGRLIEQWRTSAGTLRAFGIGTPRIAVAWLVVVAGLNGLGALLGAATARVLGSSIVASYQQATGFPLLLGSIGWGPTFEVLAFTAAWVPFALVPVLRTLSQPTTALLNPRASSVHGTLPASSRLLDPLPPAVRLGLLRIVRAPGLALTTAVSIAGTVGIAASMWVFSTAHRDNVEAMLTARQWDAVWVARPGSDASDLLDGHRWEPVATANARLAFEGRRFEAQAVAYPIPSTLQSDAWMVEGRPLGPNDTGDVLVGTRDRTAYDLALGDELSVSLGSAEPVPLRIVGFVNAFSRDQIVVHPRALDGVATGELALVESDEAGLDALARSPRTGVLLRRDDLARTARAVTGNFVITVRIYGGLGAIAAWVLLTSALLTRLRDREAQTAALSALGLPAGFAFRAALAEGLCLALIAGLLAIPLVYASCTAFQARFAEAGMYVPLHHDALLLTLCLGLPLGVALTVAPAILRHLRRTPLAAALSHRE
ncbi:MAG: FtsX-like permease family protein [Deltaproteobacteria bacterium]|nr:MAG: FtsX-like permease family protein [Deltaproteobacteria bacterium]